MKKINGKYQLSNTDKKHIEARTRAFARKASYDGSIEAWFNTETGDVRYCELIANDYIEARRDHMQFVCSAPCYECR